MTDLTCFFQRSQVRIFRGLTGFDAKPHSLCLLLLLPTAFYLVKRAWQADSHVGETVEESGSVAQNRPQGVNLGLAVCMLRLPIWALENPAHLFQARAQRLLQTGIRFQWWVGPAFPPPSPAGCPDLAGVSAPASARSWMCVPVFACSLVCWCAQE